MSLLSHPQPACREAVFELPSVVEDSGKRRAPPDVPRGNTRSVASSPSSGRKTRLVLAAALAVLPGFIPEQAAAACAPDPDTLYISGGGGGSRNSGTIGTGTGASGGHCAGAGTGDSGRRGGGGAYVGTGWADKPAGIDGNGDTGGKGVKDDISVLQDAIAEDGKDGGYLSNYGDSTGNGGSASLTIGALTDYTKISITAGDGGSNAHENAPGVGGNASLVVTGDLSLEELQMASGVKGGDYSYEKEEYSDDCPRCPPGYITVTIPGGAGGKASLIAGKLIADTINLTKNDNGALFVNVGTLDVSQDTALTLNGTIAGDGSGDSSVFFTNIDIVGGYTLAVTRDSQNGGNYTFNTLNVHGKRGAPAIYEDNGGTLDAAGKTLNFYLPYDIATGDTSFFKFDGGEVKLDSDTNIQLFLNGDLTKSSGEITLIDAQSLLVEDDDIFSSPIPAKAQDGVILNQEYNFTIEVDAEDGDVRAAWGGGGGSGSGDDEGDEEDDDEEDDDEEDDEEDDDDEDEEEEEEEGDDGGGGGSGGGDGGGSPPISSLALINQGADLIAGRGMESVTACAGQAMRATDTNYCVFGLVSGSTLRYDTGSHLKMNSLSAMTGFSRSADLASGRLTLGAFLEYGDGSYDTSGKMPSNGDAYYIGGGFLAHLDFANDFYFETSVRVGQMNNNSDMTVILSDGSRRETGFKFAVPYVGLYAGAGYVWPVTQETSLEWYGKYFWTWMEGKSTSLRTGERVSFDAMDSHRLRAGLRFSHMLTETLSAYAGVAYEHEFDAKVRAGTYSYGLTGGTGFGEIGLRVKPTPSQPLSIDFGVQGHAGKREGVTASVKVEYRF